MRIKETRSGLFYHPPESPVEAQLEPLNDVERFLSLLRFDSRGKLKDFGLKLGALDNK